MYAVLVSQRKQPNEQRFESRPLIDLAASQIVDNLHLPRLLEWGRKESGKHLASVEVSKVSSWSLSCAKDLIWTGVFVAS